MPKQKTHKATKKRFRLTATGKVKHRPAGKSHRNSRMSQKRTRQLRGSQTMNPTETSRVVELLCGNSY